MKVPVYITTNASFYIGDVEIDTPEQFIDASDKLWESQDYDTPTLCHQCADLELSDFDVLESHLDYYFKPEK